MITIKHINSCFKIKPIFEYITDMIAIYDYHHIDDLPFSNQCELASLLIDAAGRSGESEFLAEQDITDIIVATKIALKETNKDEELVTVIKEKAVSYYHYTMKALFDYVHEDYETSLKAWAHSVRRFGDPDRQIHDSIDGL